MTLIQMSQCRLERCAEMVCMNRNKSIPVELGKSLFETIPNGVLFSNAHYLLDSTFSDYTNPVAKVEFDDVLKVWRLSIPTEADDSQWIPYPFLSQSVDLTAIMREIEKDPKSYFW